MRMGVVLQTQLDEFAARYEGSPQNSDYKAR
jgi:hypothetical protein